MAFQFNNYTVKATLVAGEDLDNEQFRFVKLDAGNGTAKKMAADTDRPIGVLQNNPKNGEEAEVLIVGGTKIAAAGTASPGQVVFSASNGQAETADLGPDEAASARFLVGTFITDASASAIVTAVVDCANAGRGA
jgi:hypothetical protein